MSQQVKVYRTLDFYKSSSPTKIASFNCVDSGTIIYFRPETDDTGALYFGDGTKDMDVRFTLGSAAVYAEFNVGNAQFKLAGVDISTDNIITFSASNDSAAVADTVTLGGYEISAGHRALAIGCEEAVVSEAIDAADRTLPVRINGTNYKFLLHS